MADVKESALTQQSDCKWVRALDANGNSIRISKEDLASVVGGLLDSKQLYPFMDRGIVTDFNAVTKAGMYLIGDYYRNYPGNPGIQYGTLEVYISTDFGNKNTVFVTQIASDMYDQYKMYRRTFTVGNGESVEWIEV